MINDFYKAGEYHKCRFCGIDIQNLHERVIAQAVQKNDGSWVPAVTKKVLLPNALYAMGTIPLRNGSSFRFNGCIECVKKVDYKAFMAICKNDANMLQYMYKSATRPKLSKCKVKVQDIAEISQDTLRYRG